MGRREAEGRRERGRKEGGERRKTGMERRKLAGKQSGHGHGEGQDDREGVRQAGRKDKRLVQSSRLDSLVGRNAGKKAGNQRRK